MKKREIVISAVFPKGGEWKSTMIQTVTTSKAFSKHKVGILEADSQNSLSDWLKERKDSGLPDLGIELFKYDPKQELKAAILRYKHDLDYLFVDLPGESEAAELTRGALAYSDICITPIRPSDKAIRAFENNFLPMLQLVLDLRLKGGEKNPFYLLPTFAHTSTHIDNHREIFEPYGSVINIMKSIHRDRQLFTYFSQGGQTLNEYRKELSSTKKKGDKELEMVDKGVIEIETIASEIIKITN